MDSNATARPPYYYYSNYNYYNYNGSGGGGGSHPDTPQPAAASHHHPLLSSVVEYEFFRQPDWNATGDLLLNSTGHNNNDCCPPDGGAGGPLPPYEWDEYWGAEWSYPSGYSRTGIILTSLFVTAIMILIVVGNMLVCIAIATEKSLKTVQNWFIASLAVSDFLVGLVVMPFSLAKEVMGYWIFGRFWCEMHSALDVFLCTASINSLCLISLDRYWSVTHAVEYLRKRTPRRSLLMIGGVWILSAVISLPPLVGWKKPEKPSDYPECLLSDDVGYVLYSAFGSFYVPAFVMVFVYCRIFVAARSRARRHLRQRQRAAAELTTITMAARSTTTGTTTTTTTGTTGTTSFGNASPTSQEPKSPAAPVPTPQPPLEKIPESNGGDRPAAVQVAPPPEIVIDTSPVEEGPAPPPSPLALADEDDERQHRQGTTEEEEGRCQLFVSSESSSPPPPQPQQQQGAAKRRPSSLLRAPRFLKSPFGSTLSLADLGRSEEDVSGRKNNNAPAANKKPVAHQTGGGSGGNTVASEAERQRRRIARAKERRATLILGLIMASFILAWLPFFVLYVLEALCSACDIGPTGFAVAFWLGYCNSALNPIIYTIFNRDFRRAFRKILFK